MTLESDVKFEEKLDLRSKKWNEEFGKFLPEHSKSQNWDFDRILLFKVENVKA